MTTEGRSGEGVPIGGTKGGPVTWDVTSRLNALHNRYKDQDLVVVGFYHHKAKEPVRPREVARLARKMGMAFPLAIDYGWRTLRRYWLERVPGAQWTSVSFLIDRDDLVRYVHPGGTITKADAGHLAREISALLDARRRAR